MTFWDHVEALRTTLIRSLISILLSSFATFWFYKKIFSALFAPIGLDNLYLINPLEGFATAVKLSLWGGVLFSSPFWLMFLLQFLLPALQVRERRLLLPFLILSICFMGIGIFIAIKMTIPLLVEFFTQFNLGLGYNVWSLGQTFDLFLGLILAHAIIFECYIILMFLIHLKLLHYAMLKKARKAAIIAIFIIAALLTPPDVLSQLLLAFPMLILFESALLFARLRAIKIGVDDHSNHFLKHDDL